MSTKDHQIQTLYCVIQNPVCVLQIKLKRKKFKAKIIRPYELKCEEGTWFCNTEAQGQVF